MPPIPGAFLVIQLLNFNCYKCPGSATGWEGCGSYHRKGGNTGNTASTRNSD